MQLCIFDIDGTLTDSVVQHQTSFLKALLSYGLVCKNREWGSYRHHSDSAIFCELVELEKGYLPGKDEIESLDATLHSLFLEEVSHTPLRAIAGARAFVETLEKRGIAVAFATGSMRSSAREKLTFLLGDGWREELLSTANEYLSREEIVEGAIRRASKAYGIAHFSRILSFGDGLWDATTARALSLEFIGITSDEAKFRGVCDRKSLYPTFEHITLEGIGLTQP